MSKKEDQMKLQSQVSKFNKNVGMYLEFKKTINTLTDKSKEIKLDIMPVVLEKGIKDDKGSYLLKTDSEDIVKIENRVSISINESKALVFCKKKKLNNCVVTKTLETIDRDALEIEVKEGTITEKEFKEITSKKETQALVIKGAK